MSPFFRDQELYALHKYCQIIYDITCLLPYSRHRSSIINLSCKTNNVIIIASIIHSINCPMKVYLFRRNLNIYSIYNSVCSERDMFFCRLCNNAYRTCNMKKDIPTQVSKIIYKRITI